MPLQPHMAHKPKWRWVGQVSHCFVKADEAAPIKYRSLCGRYVRATAGGGAARRPPPWLRCGACDGAEMDMLGWSESGDETKDWEIGLK